MTIRLVIVSMILGAVGLTQTPSADKRVRRAEMDRMPVRFMKEMLSQRQLVGSPNLAYTQPIVTVAFNGGSEPVYDLIESTASTWTKSDPNSKLSFSFRDSSGRFRQWSESDSQPVADIRISFARQGPYSGYWSAIGILAIGLPPGSPTMNLGDLDAKLSHFAPSSPVWLTSYEHTVILHEFGHAIGLSHEHFHPDCQADLLMPKVLSYLHDTQAWNPDVARLQMDAKYYFDQLASQVKSTYPNIDNRLDISPHIDRDSIMLYPAMPSDLYKHGALSPCRPANSIGYATNLSQGDLYAYRSYYDKPQSSAVPVAQSR